MVQKGKKGINIAVFKCVIQDNEKIVMSCYLF